MLWCLGKWEQTQASRDLEKELHYFPSFIPKKLNVLAGSSTGAELSPLQTKKLNVLSSTKVDTSQPCLCQGVW